MGDPRPALDSLAESLVECKYKLKQTQTRMAAMCAGASGTVVTWYHVSHYMRRQRPLKVYHQWQELLQGHPLSILRDLKCSFDDFVSWISIPAVNDSMAPLPSGEDAPGKPLHYSYVEHQGYFKQQVEERSPCRITFPAADLHKVWRHVCRAGQPHDALLPCRSCGYTYPLSEVVAVAGVQQRHEACIVWECQACLADGGLCLLAARASYRTRWRQTAVCRNTFAAASRSYSRRGMWSGAGPGVVILKRATAVLGT